MSWIDVFTAYLYLLKMVAIGVAVVIFISSLDDLFIDIAYWVRRVWRAFTVYARHAPLNYKTLYDAEEKPLAIMVPAWQEHVARTFAEATLKAPEKSFAHKGGRRGVHCR